jgi:hypothetical protein
VNEQRVNRHIVVAFRMPPAGVTLGPEGAYLARARSMCARGEALGGKLIAWSAAVIALSWDTDSLEEAILLATSIREESLSPERAWACGLAEGSLEPLAPDGQRMHLAWGDALLSAVSLARAAKPGEVLVHGELPVVLTQQLVLAGARASTDSGRRVRGWCLDIEHPWKRGQAPSEPPPDSADRFIASRPREAPRGSLDCEATPEIPVDEFPADEVSTDTLIRIVQSFGPSPRSASGEEGSPSRRVEADRVRGLIGRDSTRAPVEMLAERRRLRAMVDGGSPAARCQAALALAMTLTIGGRTEEALVEALDALARAREAHDPKAIGACMALLSKLYASAGFLDAATKLKESAAG